MTQSRGKLHEHSFNVEFGKALAETDARWRAHADEYILTERPGTLDRGRADVLIDDPSMPAAAVETSFDPADADKDAQEKLGRRTTRGGRRLLAVLAVHIPEECRDLSTDAVAGRLRDGSQILGYALHQEHSTDEGRRRWPAAGFIRGTVHSAGRLVASAAMPKEVVDARSESVALLVKQAAEMLRSKLHARAQREVATVVGQNSPLEGLRTTMVLWLNALLTQQRLHVQGVEGIPHLQSMSGVRPNPAVQVQVWRRIIAVNWRSIFGPAVQALEACGDRHRGATTEALLRLIEAVGVIEDADLGQHINVGAELFPKLAADRKASAAFYTQPATAELLARLTIRRRDRTRPEWADPDLLLRSVIADLACGTGSLLRAGYLRVQALHEWAGGTEGSVARLHRGAMEFGLRGTDISPIAAHLTSSSLASIGHGESYGDTQVGWVKVGGELSRTGALEYIKQSFVEDLFRQNYGRSSGNKDAASSVDVRHDSVDWVLMNPPYSRTRGGQSAFDLAGVPVASDRRACQRRWRDLMRGQPAQLRAGMAASFLVIARHKVRPGTGRIGFVLPLTCAFADTWAPTRAMVETEFTDIVVIATASGASLRQASFSADTGMEEMLLVATRREQPDRGAATSLHCVTLYEPCTRNGEASETGRAIEQAVKQCAAAGTTCPVSVGDSEIGCVTVMAARGEGLPWNMVGVTHGGLALAADALTRGTIDHVVAKPIPLGLAMGTIGEIFQVGPTHHLLGHLRGRAPIGAFEFHPVRDEVDAIGADRSLWQASGRQQRALRVLPSHKGVTPAGGVSTELQERMRATAGTLFYARNLRWTSQALLAATTARPALGGRAWTALRHADPRVLKAAALWWNSTLGLVVHWTQGSRTQSGRSTAQIGALKRIPCPRLDKLADAALELAAERFEALSERVLLPVREVAADPVRQEIDAAVAAMLATHKDHLVVSASIEPSLRGLDARSELDIGSAVSLVKELLAAEPSVQGG